MRLQTSIEDKLRRALDPEHLEVINESGMHAVEPGAETHFRVRVVSSAFEDEPLVQRHRTVYEILEQERREGIHALGIQALTPAEYEQERGPLAESPPCLGGDGERPGS